MGLNTSWPSPTHIRPAWLIPQEDGQKCQQHALTLGLIGLYNFISIIISLLFASPMIFKQTKYILDSSGRGFKYAWRWIRRKPAPSIERETTFNNQTTSLLQLTMSISGSLALSILSPVLAGVSIRKQNHSINLWIIISQWCLRPRATVLHIFSTGRFLLKTDDIWVEEYPPHGYFTTLTSSIATDAIVSSMGYPFLVNQVQSFQPEKSLLSLVTNGNHHFDKMQSIFAANLVAISVELVVLLPFFITYFVLLIGSFLKLKIMKYNIEKFLPLLPFAGIALFLVYLTSWLLWINFFDAVPKEQYCLASSSTWISVSYCLLPVALGLWRSFCAIVL